MDTTIKKIEEAINLMGFENVKTDVDEEYRKISIIIDDDLIQAHVEKLLPAFDHIFNLFLRKAELPPHVVDINYYRKERERLITELARAAAHKATVTKGDVELPPMNSYERRIVHMEIALHPELETESIGEAKERKVTVKHITA